MTTLRKEKKGPGISSSSSPLYLTAFLLDDDACNSQRLHIIPPFKSDTSYGKQQGRRDITDTLGDKLRDKPLRSK